MSFLTSGCTMITLERQTTMFNAPNRCSGGVDLPNSVNESRRNARTYSDAKRFWTNVKVGINVAEVRVFAKVRRNEVAVETPLW